MQQQLRLADLTFDMYRNVHFPHSSAHLWRNIVCPVMIKQMLSSMSY